MEEDLKHKEIMEALNKQDEVLKGISTRQDKQDNWNKIHEQNDGDRFAEMAKKPTEKEVTKQKEEFEASVERAMVKAIQGAGKWSYAKLLIVAGVIGALAVIFGGFKVILMPILGFFGFTKI